MARALGGLRHGLACALLLGPLAGWCQAGAGPRVVGLSGVLEIDRIIEVRIDGLQAWGEQTGALPWRLVPYLDGRALRGLTPLAVNLHQGRVQFHLRITADNRATWTHLLSPLTFQRAVHLSVGLEQVDPFDSDFTRQSGRAQLTVLNARWLLAAAAVVVAFACAFFALAAHTTLLMERCAPRPGAPALRFSLAKVQLALWFFVVFSAFLVIWLATGNFDSLNGSIVATLSISAGTALGDSVVKAASPGADPGSADPAIDPFLAPAWTVRRFLRDLVSDGQGCSLSRLQMLAWTAALVIVFLADVHDDLQMPLFGPELLYLLGLSSGTYMAHRLPELLNARPPDSPTAQPPSAPAPPPIGGADGHR